MKNNKQYYANGILLIIVFSSFLFYAFSGGVTGKTQLSGSDGCSCHSFTSSPQIEVVIGGPDVLASNQTAEYTLNITGGSLNAAGINIAASSGTLIPGEGLQLLGGELTHISPIAPTGSAVIVSFSFTAPDSGSAIIYATGNSVNLNGSVTGDAWNFSLPRNITISPVTGINDEIFTRSFKLEQNYPNPFNPSTTIKYSLAQTERVTLSIYDLSGREVVKLIDEEKPAGEYDIKWNASSYSSGVYFIKMQAGQFSETRKVVLMK
jgi:hypothetical protein